MPARLLKLDAFLPYRLSVASNCVSNAIAGTYEALFGLTIPEWRVLAWVAEAGAITQGAIGTATRMDKVSVSRAAIALADRGLLERRPNPDDRRSHLLALTPAGTELHATVAPKALELERRIFARFHPDELAQLAAMLREIEAAALALDGPAPERPTAD